MTEEIEINKGEEKRKAEADRRQRERESISDAFNRIFATPDGKLLGEWLIENCGFLKPSVVFLNGTIFIDSTVYNEARRGLYLDLRRYFNEETLINLEIEEK